MHPAESDNLYLLMYVCIADPSRHIGHLEPFVSGIGQISDLVDRVGRASCILGYTVRFSNLAIGIQTAMKPTRH